MHIIVGGCGRLGAEIAELLTDDPDIDVIVIDVDALAFDRLGSTFNGETVVGNVTDRDVLEQAGASYADALIAVTRFDNANLMAVEIAEHLYGVPRAIARLFNPEREQVYRKLGIRYVSGTSLLAKLFLNELRDDAFPLHVRLRHPDIALVDLEVSSGGHGAIVDDLEIDGRLRVAVIQRGARTFVPLPNDRLERGDILTAAVRQGTYRRIAHLTEPPHRLAAAEREQ